MNNPPLCRSWLRAACFALALTPLASTAQVKTEVKDPRVKSIRVMTEFGVASEQFVLGFVALRPGEPYTTDAVASTVRSLYATGRFEQVEVVPKLDTESGKVDVEVRVTPRSILKSIEYIGGEGLVDRTGSSSLFGGTVALEDVKVGEPLDPAVLRRAVLKLQAELRKKRPFTIVDSQLVKKPGGVQVAIVINEGADLRVDEIRIEGAEKITQEQIIAGADLKASNWRWWKLSWLTSGGRLDPEDYRKDCQRIRDYYRSKGFLDVQIEDLDPQKVCKIKNLEAGSGWLDTVFKVKEGPRYSIGKISIEGNRLAAGEPIFSTESLLKVTASPSLRRGVNPDDIDHITTGDAFSTTAVEAAVEKLREYYGQMGYINAQVQLERKPDLTTGAIDLKFTINEGQRFTVRAVEIQGNTKTRSTVIARELALGPGEVFDLARTRVSQARLKGTQFFEEVSVSPQSTTVPGQSDLRITVKEGNTGAVSFGAGYNTVQGIVGFVEYTEANFDYSNSEGWFRGGGQKFRVRLEVGSLSSSLEQSFEEPALWGRELAVGYSIERRYAGYASANYSVLTEGISLYARKRIFSYTEGRIAYNLRRVSVGNVTASAPADVVTENGAPKVISSLSASLVYDTRDELNFPTKGSRISLTEELAGNGLGGNLKYLKSEARAGRWFLVSPTAQQTISVIGRVGLFTGSGGYLPFYERFYLGGAYDMRGFNYNDVGSYSTYDTSFGNQPMGGLTYGYFSTEYTIKAAENLHLAAFLDYGLLNRSETDFSVSEANSDWGVGMRILLGGAVMRLDFGFPLQSTKIPVGQINAGQKLNSGGMKFNFSFGTVF